MLRLFLWSMLKGFPCHVFCWDLLSLRGMSSELQTHAQLIDSSHKCREAHSLNRVRAQAESSMVSAILLRCNCAPHDERLSVLLWHHDTWMHPVQSRLASIAVLVCSLSRYSTHSVPWHRRQAWAGLFMAGGKRSASYLFQKVRKAYRTH